MHPRIHARNQPETLALAMAGSGESVTYGELEARANRGAHALRALGLGIGDTLAMACDNRPEFFDICWAAQRCGVTLVPMSTRLKADEIAYIADDSGARALLITEYMADTARALDRMRAAMPGVAHIRAIGAIDPLESWNSLRAVQPATPVADEASGGRMPIRRAPRAGPRVSVTRRTVTIRSSPMPPPRCLAGSIR